MFMQKAAIKAVGNYLLMIFPLVLLVSCVHTPSIMGKWQEPGTTSSIELKRDGTFKVVDSMGMQVSGNYTLHSNKQIRLEIKSNDTAIETLEGNFTVQGDELILSFDDAKEILKYKKTL